MTRFQGKAQMRMADTATNKAEDLSMQLIDITQLVELAAFAAEARRTLNAIQRLKRFDPVVCKTIDLHVKCPDDWGSFPDSSGLVLHEIGRQLEKINTAFTKTVFDLANGEEECAESNHDDGSAIVIKPAPNPELKPCGACVPENGGAA